MIELILRMGAAVLLRDLNCLLASHGIRDWWGVTWIFSIVIKAGRDWEPAYPSSNLVLPSCLLSTRTAD